MIVKTKKSDYGRTRRVEGVGELKEVIFNEDFSRPDESRIALCFRGSNSSGIVELSPEELDFISKEIAPKLGLLGDVKLLKFPRDRRRRKVI